MTNPQSGNQYPNNNDPKKAQENAPEQKKNEQGTSPATPGVSDPKLKATAQDEKQKNA